MGIFDILFKKKQSNKKISPKKPATKKTTGKKTEVKKSASKKAATKKKTAKKILIDKYGEEYGTMLYSRKLSPGMTKEMVSDLPSMFMQYTKTQKQKLRGGFILNNVAKMTDSSGKLSAEMKDEIYTQTNHATQKYVQDTDDNKWYYMVFQEHISNGTIRIPVVPKGSFSEAFEWAGKSEEERNIEKIYKDSQEEEGVIVLIFNDTDVLDRIEKEDYFWIDMPKSILLGLWGTPQDEKKDVSKKGTKLKWYYDGRTTRQGTTAYKYEVQLENDLVVGWKELE